METVEINKILHEFMGKCWHEREVDPKGTSGFKVKMRCVHCGDSRYRINCTPNPKYDSEASPRRLLAEVEAKFIEAFGKDIYYSTLEMAVTSQPGWSVPFDIPTASALTRSTAMAEYLREKK